MLSPSAYDDGFARNALPPSHLWPELSHEVISSLYPSRLNAAELILQRGLQLAGEGAPCVAGQGERLSYGEFEALTNRLAQVLQDDYALKSGERVLLRGVNSPTLAALWFAVVKAGGIAVTTMPLLRQRELIQIIDKANIQLALFEDALQSELTGISGVKTVNFERLIKAARRKPKTFKAFQAAQDDVALIAFTSGTTGAPKATAHFHRDLLAICHTVPASVLKSTPQDVFIGSAPLGFTYGLGSLLLFPLWQGASTVFLARATPETLLAAIKVHQVTTLLTGPTLYRTMLQHTINVPSLKLCCSSGEHLPTSVWEAWKAATGLSICNILGATEMLHAFVAGLEGCPPGALGRALPHYETQVVDEAMHPVQPHCIGRLAVKGPTGCRYLDDEVRQKTYVQQGWNLTGDAFSYDENGFLYYHARTDDMIICSGYNISGAELENVLLEHEAVSQCAVIGIEDAARGAIAKAFIVLKAGYYGDDILVAQLQNHVKTTLAPYKYPRAIEFLEALPMTTTGKIQRSALRGR